MGRQGERDRDREKEKRRKRARGRQRERGREREREGERKNGISHSLNVVLPFFCATVRPALCPLTRALQ